MAGTAAIAGLGVPAHAQSTRPIRIATTFDNSGVEKANGSGAFLGARACVEAFNRNGGVEGRSVELVMADDGFAPERAVANARMFQSESSILALLSPLGTRQTAAVMDAVRDMAIVGPITGTAGLRRASPPNLFWVRASYDHEVDKLVETATTSGHTRIGIVYPDDPLGKSVLAAFERALARFSLKPAVAASTPGTTSPVVEPAARAVREAEPQLVVMALAGVAPLFVRALRELDAGRTTIYGLSISINAANVEAMGPLGRGVGFAIVFPSPFVASSAVVRRYQADMKAIEQQAFSLPSLEGHVNARVLLEGIRRAGPSVTRSGLVAALDRIEAFDLGGMRIGYGGGNRVGGRFVDLAVIDRFGQVRT